MASVTIIHPNIFIVRRIVVMSLNCKLLPNTKRVMEGFSRMWWKSQVRFVEEGERVIALPYSAEIKFKNYTNISLSAGQISIRIIFPDSVFKNLIIFIFYKYVLFMDKITVFLTLELLELIFHGNCWKRPHFETFKLRN